MEEDRIGRGDARRIWWEAPVQERAIAIRVVNQREFEACAREGRMYRAPRIEVWAATLLELRAKKAGEAPPEPA